MEEGLLTPQEGRLLLKIARKTIKALLKGEKIPKIEEKEGGLLQKRGAFVSLHRKGELRGCIGSFETEKPLYEIVQNMAEQAAFHDPRFSPLTEKELDEVEIEISVLSPLKEIKNLEEIEIGKHGLYVKKGLHRGVLLPQVATEYGWDRETFLKNTYRKAGLPPHTSPKDVQIYIFSAQIFSEENESS